MLEIGDSLGVDLGYGLQDVLGGDPAVKLEPLAVVDTGLADPRYYDWPATLARDLTRYHPAIVIVLLGGNDCQSFASGSGSVVPQALGGTSAFDLAYGARVATMMTEATSAGAKVFWVGVPVMAQGADGDAGYTFSNCMAELDDDFAAVADVHPGVSFFSTWKLFETRLGKYSEYLSVGGNIEQVRAPDGIHIEPPGGTDLLARAVVQAMDAAYHVRL